MNGNLRAAKISKSCAFQMQAHSIHTTEQVKVQIDFIKAQINDILERMVEKDEEMFFAEPVPEDIPGYYETIENPMDMSTMQQKNEDGQYKTFEDFQVCFNTLSHFLG